MIIEIIGSDCVKGKKLYNKINRLVEELNPDIQVIKANAEYSVKKYKVKEKPGLVVNKKLISEGNVPDILHDKRVIALELTGMIAGTKYRGAFTEQLQKIIDFCLSLNCS